MNQITPLPVGTYEVPAGYLGNQLWGIPTPMWVSTIALILIILISFICGGYYLMVFLNQWKHYQQEYSDEESKG